jgi:hypothetical protein
MHRHPMPPLMRPTRYRLLLLTALLAVTLAAMLRWWPDAGADVPSRPTPEAAP